MARAEIQKEKGTERNVRNCRDKAIKYSRLEYVSSHSRTQQNDQGSTIKDIRTNDWDC